MFFAESFGLKADDFKQTEGFSGLNERAGKQPEEVAKEAEKTLENIVMHAPNNAQIAAKAAIQASLNNIADNARIDTKNNFDGDDNKFTAEEFKAYADHLEAKIEETISSKSRTNAKEAGEKAIDADTNLSNADKTAAKTTNEMLANAGQNIEEAMKSINSSLNALVKPEDATVDMKALKTTLKSHSLSILAAKAKNIESDNKHNAYLVNQMLKDEASLITSSLIPAAQQFLFFQSNTYKEALKKEENFDEIQQQVLAFTSKVLNAESLLSVPSGIYGNEQWWKTAKRWISTLNEVAPTPKNILETAVKGVDEKVKAVKETAKSDDEKLGEKTIGNQESLKNFEGKLTPMNFLSPDLAEKDADYQAWYLAGIGACFVPGVGELIDGGQVFSSNDAIVGMMKQFGFIDDPNYTVQVEVWERVLAGLGVTASILSLGAAGRATAAAKFAAAIAKMGGGKMIGLIQSRIPQVAEKIMGSRKSTTLKDAEKAAKEAQNVQITEPPAKPSFKERTDDIAPSKLQNPPNPAEGRQDNAMPPVENPKPTEVKREGEKDIHPNDISIKPTDSPVDLIMGEQKMTSNKDGSISIHQDANPQNTITLQKGESVVMQTSTNPVQFKEYSLSNLTGQMRITEISAENANKITIGQVRSTVPDKLETEKIRQRGEQKNIDDLLTTAQKEVQDQLKINRTKPSEFNEEKLRTAQNRLANLQQQNTFNKELAIILDNPKGEISEELASLQKANANIKTNEERIKKAEHYLGNPLSEAQAKALIDAHNAEGIPAKTKILAKDNLFTAEQRRIVERSHLAGYWKATEEMKQVTRNTDVGMVGDLHGNFKIFEANLLSLGFTDKTGNWIAGNRKLVFHGDILGDRNTQSIDIILAIEKLREQARAAGGDIDIISGNHEDIAIAFLTKEKTADSVQNKGAGGAEAALASDQGKGIIEFANRYLGKQYQNVSDLMNDNTFKTIQLLPAMRSSEEGMKVLQNIAKLKLISQTDDTFYFHTPMTEKMGQLLLKYNINEINTIYQKGLSDMLIKGETPSDTYTELKNIFLDTGNSTFNRSGISGVDTRKSRPLLSDETAKALKAKYGVHQMIHGHETIKDSREIAGIRMVSVDNSAGTGGDVGEERATGFLNTQGNLTTTHTDVNRTAFSDFHESLNPKYHQNIETTLESGYVLQLKDGQYAKASGIDHTWQTPPVLQVLPNDTKAITLTDDLLNKEIGSIVEINGKNFTVQGINGGTNEIFVTPIKQSWKEKVRNLFGNNKSNKGEGEAEPTSNHSKPDDQILPPNASSSPTSYANTQSPTNNIPMREGDAAHNIAVDKATSILKQNNRELPVKDRAIINQLKIGEKKTLSNGITVQKNGIGKYEVSHENSSILSVNEKNDAMAYKKIEDMIGRQKKADASSNVTPKTTQNNSNNSLYFPYGYSAARAPIVAKIGNDDKETETTQDTSVTSEAPDLVAQTPTPPEAPAPVAQTPTPPEAPALTPQISPTPPENITLPISPEIQTEMKTFLQSKKSDFESTRVTLREQNIALKDIAANYKKGDWESVNKALLETATNAGMNFPTWAKSDRNKVRYLQALIMGDSAESYINYSGKAGPKTITALLKYLQ